ncbi:MAG: glycosyltransferase [Sulfurimonas sp.]|nr:glycosyltransferase [Sulfurimonas sp.]
MINRTEQEIMKNWKSDFSKPVVSVCTITYNHEKYIREAIDSFLMQETNFSFEIVIGEDCSSDNTRQIIENYKENYPHIIKLIVSEKNVGMQANVQNTMQACQGEYIAFCEGDDYWTDTNKLQIQKVFLESNPECVICYTSVEAFNENGIIDSYIGGAIKDLTTDELKQAAPINTLTVMFKNIIKKLPLEMLLSKHGDLFIWSILGHYGTGKYLSQIKPSRYRMHSGGVHSMISENNRYENALITYSMLFTYYKRLNETKMTNYFQKKLLEVHLRMDNSIFEILLSILKQKIRKIMYKIKNIYKNNHDR